MAQVSLCRYRDARVHIRELVKVGDWPNFVRPLRTEDGLRVPGYGMD